MRAHTSGERLNVGVLFKVVRNRDNRRQIPDLLLYASNRIKNGLRRLRGVLCIKRQHDDALGLLCGNPGKLLFDALHAVAHRPGNNEAVAQNFLKFLRRLGRHRHQRRPFLRPHRLVAVSRGLCPARNDDAAQNRLPDERIHFHHASIAQKFRKILRHCFFGRSGRRTGIADENGGLGYVVLRGHRIQKRRLDQVRAIVHELS